MNRLSFLIILWVFCFSVRTQNLPVPVESPSPRGPIVIPLVFEKGKYLIPIQFSSGDTNLLVAPRMRSSVTWINSYKYIRHTNKTFDCEELKTCQVQSLSRINDRGVIEGLLVKERIKLGGHTLSNLDVFMLTKIISGRLRGPPEFGFLEDIFGIIGLGFNRDQKNPNVPTFMESLKTQGLLERPAFSFQLNDEGGELILREYNHTESEREILKLDQETPGLSVRLLGMGIKGTLKDLPANYKVVFDPGYPGISIPDWLSNAFVDEEEKNDLVLNEPTPSGMPEKGPFGEFAVNCGGRIGMPDLVLMFDRVNIRIPASVYISYGKGYLPDKTEASEKGCFYHLQGEEVEGEIILGRPFFKAFSPIFDYETQTVSLSAKRGLDSEIFDPSKDMTYTIMAVGVASFLLFGFCICYMGKNFRKPDVPFSGEGVPLDESSPEISDSLPDPQGFSDVAESLPYPQGFAPPIESLPYINIPSNE